MQTCLKNLPSLNHNTAAQNFQNELKLFTKDKRATSGDALLHSFANLEHILRGIFRTLSSINYGAKATANFIDV